MSAAALAKSDNQVGESRLSSPFESLLSPHIMALSIAEVAANLLNKGNTCLIQLSRLGANDATEEDVFLGNSVQRFTV
jgi:hypothetical protein